MSLDPNHVEWSRLLFASLKEGAVWGVPRSLLIFQRRGETLVLLDPRELTEDQQFEYDGIVEHFGAAGVTVMKGGDAKAQPSE
jgi:hypothetical protein